MKVTSLTMQFICIRKIRKNPCIDDYKKCTYWQSIGQWNMKWVKYVQSSSMQIIKCPNYDWISYQWLFVLQALLFYYSNILRFYVQKIRLIKKTNHDPQYAKLPGMVSNP